MSAVRNQARRHLMAPCPMPKIRAPPQAAALCQLSRMRAEEVDKALKESAVREDAWRAKITAPIRGRYVQEAMRREKASKKGKELEAESIALRMNSARNDAMIAAEMEASRINRARIADKLESPEAN